jgi:hypothetical protein
MKTYTLLAVFLATGDSYPERTGLSLMQCAGHAAMTRSQTAELYQHVGEVRCLCVPERSLAQSSTDTHGIGPND